jgi:hypothetical protein
MNYINKIIITSSGLERVNGAYIRNSSTDRRFLAATGCFIEQTCEGWYLVDYTTNEQVFLFDFSFENVFVAGDGITPLPIFTIQTSEIT